MGRQARFRIASIDDLFRQLKVASAGTRRREMDSAEQLLSELEPDGAYPLDYIIFRITGYRPPKGDEPVMLAGAALIADLATLIQRLSAALELQSSDMQRVPIALGDVAKRLNVSSKTIQRYRGQGLVCHEIDVEGESRLVCFEDALARFLNQHPAKVARAGNLTRIDSDIESAMIEEAQMLRDREDISLNEAAARIAVEHERAHETVRGILRRHDRRAVAPIFNERGALTDRDHRVMLRASQRGIEPAVIAKHFNRSTKVVHRVVLKMRAARLKALILKSIALPTFALPDADEVLLSPAIVRAGLNDPTVPGDAIELLKQFRGSMKLDEESEHALVAGYNVLKWRAALSIDEVADVPTAAQIDRIETDLRWAAILKRQLAKYGLAAALERVEQFLHRSLAVEPRESIVWHIRLAGEIAGRTIETLDPQRGQRVARVCGFAMDRALAASERGDASSRAAARHAPGSVAIEDPFRRLCPWQAWLDMPAAWREQVNSIKYDAARVLAMHYGWAGDAPLTTAEIAEQIGKSPSAVTNTFRRSMSKMRSAARSVV